MSLGCGELTDQGAKKRGLAHAIVAENAKNAGFFSDKRGAHQHRDAAIAGMEVFDFEDHAATCLPR